MDGEVHRRALLALGAAVLADQAIAQTPRRAVAFQIWRNGVQIGTHTVGFATRGGQLVADIRADMRIKLGPVPVFTYRHEATETWDGGRFTSLSSRTTTNGRVETVDARRGTAGLSIERGGGRALSASADCAPLTHWNLEVLQGALFNPQTGALVRCSVARRGAQPVRLADGRSIPATGFALTGDADIVDWYDDVGAWTALQARAQDKSLIEYRRL